MADDRNAPPTDETGAVAADNAPDKSAAMNDVAVVPDADNNNANQQLQQSAQPRAAGARQPYMLGFNGARAFQGGESVVLSDSDMAFTQCITCVQIVMLLGQLFAYAWALHTYVQHKDDSPGCDKPLTTWLLVNGIYGIILVAFTGMLMCVIVDMMTNGGQPSEWTMTCLPCIGLGTCCVVVPISLFHLAWVIVGSVWTYGMDRTGCSDDVYVFCYWYITFTWVAAGISCCLGRRENPYMQRIRNQA